MANNHTMKRSSAIFADNKTSILLSRDENEILCSVIGQRCVSLASAVVQVFFSEPSQPLWRKQFCGVACFVKDNPKKSFFIRVYDIMEHLVLWEQELYHEINYSQPLRFFHTFETDDRQAGLNFANEEEAHYFYAMVQEKVRLLQKRREDNLRKRDGTSNNHINNHVSKSENNHHGAQHNNHPVSTSQSVQAPYPVGSERSNNRQSNHEDKRKKQKSRRITKHDIGLPTNFVHISHIGWDPDKGFEYDDSDPTLQELFKKAGIDMKKADAATRSFIYGFIEKEFGGVSAVKKAVSVPPPPPRSQPRVPSSNQQNRPQPPPRTPPTNLRAPPALVTRLQPPPPPPLPGTLPVSKGQAPQIRGPAPGIKVNGAPAPPPPPPPPPPTAHIPSPPPPPPSNPQSISPTTPEDGDSRSALFDAIRRGRDLKPVETNAQSASLTGRDKLLNEIVTGVPLKHVDPDKISLGKEEANPQLDGMAAALARALMQRREKLQDESDEEEESEDDDDEWDS